MHRLLRDTRAVTAIEYAILASLIAMVVVASVGQVGGTVLAMFNRVNTALIGL